MFSIDLNGILTVTASLNSNRNITAEITITNSCGHIGTKAIEQMVHNSEAYRRDEKAVRDCQSVKQKLEDFCYETKNKIAQNAEIYKQTTKIVLDK